MATTNKEKHEEELRQTIDPCIDEANRIARILEAAGVVYSKEVCSGLVILSLSHFRLNGVTLPQFEGYVHMFWGCTDVEELEYDR